MIETAGTLGLSPVTRSRGELYDRPCLYVVHAADHFIRALPEKKCSD